MNTASVITNIDLFCAEQKLLPANSTVILGLSGGPDSIFLLHYLAAKAHKKEIQLVACHLDHQWRTESAKDAEFCLQQTNSLGIKLVCAKASDLSLSLKFNGSKEELGRRMRRHFLENMRIAEQADLIALAHHQQDQLETFFIRPFRGSTLSGLRSMRPRHHQYVRPLLTTKRATIIQYLHEHKIPYLIDPSNDSPLFLRNRIRHQLLPLCTTLDTRFEQNLVKILGHFADADDCLEIYTQQLMKGMVNALDGFQSLRIDALLQIHPYMQKRILVAWLCEQKVSFEPSDAWFTEIIRFLSNKESNIHQVHPDWSIIKKRGMVYCTHTT